MQGAEDVGSAVSGAWGAIMNWWGRRRRLAESGCEDVVHILADDIKNIECAVVAFEEVLYDDLPEATRGLISGEKVPNLGHNVTYGPLAFHIGQAKLFWRLTQARQRAPNPRPLPSAALWSIFP